MGNRAIIAFEVRASEDFDRASGTYEPMPWSTVRSTLPFRSHRRNGPAFLPLAILKAGRSPIEGHGQKCRPS